MELWRAIPRYEKLYEASNLGEIRTVEGKITSSSRYPKRIWKQRVLKQKFRKSNNGKRLDAMVTLWKDGKPHYYLVSRLIATTFCGDYINSNLTVNHKDGNSINNSSDNLEWISRSDNIKIGFSSNQYDNIKKKIIMVSDGKYYAFRSMTDADKFLKRYRGYTSRTFKTGAKFLINCDGIRFDIPF